MDVENITFPPAEKYSYEEVLQYLGGYKYFSKERVMYVFHKVNGQDEEAMYYKTIIDEENKQIEEAAKKFKTQEEIDELQKEVKEINI